ncbi:MAG: hypothetical protein ACLU1V_14515 [Bacteroides fragilis]
MDQAVNVVLKPSGKILIEKYHISPERISESTPEAMGYENKTGCNAMIVYIPENKQ